LSVINNLLRIVRIQGPGSKRGRGGAGGGGPEPSTATTTATELPKPKYKINAAKNAKTGVPGAPSLHREELPTEPSMRRRATPGSHGGAAAIE